MASKNQIPVTGQHRKDSSAFVLGTVLLVLALLVLAFGPTLLSRVGLGKHLNVPALRSSIEPRVAYFKGTEQRTDERYLARPAVPPRVAYFKDSEKRTDERYLAKPEVPATIVVPEPRAAYFKDTEQRTDERYLAKPEIPRRAPEK